MEVYNGIWKFLDSLLEKGEYLTPAPKNYAKSNTSKQTIQIDNFLIYRVLKQLFYLFVYK